MLHAIIRAEKMPVVKEQLRNIGIGGMTVSSVSGWSRQRVTFAVAWTACVVRSCPRMKFEIAGSDERVELVIRTIVKHARSGESGEQGDGIIFFLVSSNPLISLLSKKEKEPDLVLIEAASLIA